MNSVLPEREAALAAAETALAAATAASTIAKEVRFFRYVYPFVDVSLITRRRIHSYPIFLIHRLTRFVRMHPHSGTRRRGGEARANHCVDGRRRRDIRALSGDGLGESFTRGPGAVHGRCVFHPERPNSLPPVPNYPITDQLPTNYRLITDPFRIVHTQVRRRRSARRSASSRSGARLER